MMTIMMMMMMICSLKSDDDDNDHLPVDPLPSVVHSETYKLSFPKFKQEFAFLKESSEVIFFAK